MEFKDFGLEQGIMEALDILGYHKPFAVQEAVIPHLLAKQDVIVQAKTGSGKTASFAIPILQQLIWNEKLPQALILAPTRELAMQIQTEFDQIGAKKRIKSLAIYGKFPFRFQKQDLQQRTHVICATPGRILDHLREHTFDASSIRYVVIDEADIMLDMGFLDEVEAVLDYLPKKRTTALFSATMPKEIIQLANRFLHDPLSIAMEAKQDVHQNIEHYVYKLNQQDKETALLHLLGKETVESAILFVRTQERVESIYQVLKAHHIRVTKLHGGLLQEERLANLKAFRSGEKRILVASDVAARGIDIADISHVINVDFPDKKETYIHRLGRTARKDTSGKAISFVTARDQEKLMQLEDYLGYSLSMRDASTELLTQDYDLSYLSQSSERKEDKGAALRKDVLRIYIGAGKAKKLRAGDIAGALCQLEGICFDDVGVIQVQEHHSYVDILHGKGEVALKSLKRIKGKEVRVEIAK